MKNIALATVFSTCLTNPVFANDTINEIQGLTGEIIDFRNTYDVSFGTGKLPEQPNPTITQDYSLETQIGSFPMRLSYSHNSDASQIIGNKELEYNGYNVGSVSAIGIFNFSVEKFHIETELFRGSFGNIWVGGGISKYDLAIDVGVELKYYSQATAATIHIRDDDVYNAFLTLQFDYIFPVTNSGAIRTFGDLRYEPGNSKGEIGMGYERYIGDDVSLSAEVLHVCHEYHELLNAFDFQDGCYTQSSIGVGFEKTLNNGIGRLSFETHYAPITGDIGIKGGIQF